MGYKEAAEIAGVSIRKMRYLVESGEILARRCGSRVLIAERDLEAWLDSLPLVVDTGAEAEADTETATYDEGEGVPSRARREGAARVRAASVPDVHEAAA
ncbi:helix-turn-helix domain-containing protein [Mycobacterium avium]|uniref:DNA binding domain, excisionase family protein n=1 Tax=Mycobacterium avium (strain 104) TaxID=243243 RepID=A0A0H2ZY87_MYCA1|nr:helix-turn-helix domain-containing protein [Mycobacterium avium]ABK67363.1 DNA binding domain, excisionase family protein [Mycobacterium avium 104]